MSRTYRDRFNRANGALGSIGDGKKCLVMRLSTGSHEDAIAGARGWTVTTIDVTTGGVWPSRTAVAEYDLLVVDASYNGIDGTSAANAANAYTDGVNVFSTGNDTTAMSPLFTGTASNGTDKDIIPSGTHSLAAGWPTHFDGDNGLYLTGVNGSAFTFAVTNGTPRPLGVAMENALTGARWVHWQPYSGTHPASLEDTIYSWLGLNTRQQSLSWEILTGTFAIASAKGTSSTSPASNPLAVIPIGKRVNGSCDMFSQLTPEHVYGNAVYARVVDANNWIRAKVHSASSDVYLTEYYHPAYYTEYLYNNYAEVTEYQYSYPQYYFTKKAVVTEWQYQYSGYTAWSNWGNASTTLCRDTAPSLAATSTFEERIQSSTTTGCSGGKRKYTIQNRSRSVTTEYCWSQPGVPCNGGFYTGNTRQVCGADQSPFWRSYSSAPVSGQCETYTGTSQTVYYWATAKADSRDTATGGTRVVCGAYINQYWGGAIQSGQCDTYANQTRQVDGGGYWDTTYAGSTSSRSTYQYTNYYHGYVRLEKVVAGAITNLGEYYAGSSTPPLIRLECEGSALRVYRQGSLVVSATDAAHQTTGTKAGFGGGSSSYNQTNPSVDGFSAGGISPERVRVAGAWVRSNPKVRAGDVWVDFDTRMET